MKRIAYFRAGRAPRVLTAVAIVASASFGMPPIFAATAASAPVAVEITKFAFAPKEISVEPGTRITWVNRDEAPHTVTASDKTFASKGLDTDDKFEHVFTSEGDFSYICAVHPFMTGVVHVRKR